MVNYCHPDHPVLLLLCRSYVWLTMTHDSHNYHHNYHYKAALSSALTTVCANINSGYQHYHRHSVSKYAWYLVTTIRR